MPIGINLEQFHCSSPNSAMLIQKSFVSKCYAISIITTGCCYFSNSHSMSSCKGFKQRGSHRFGCSTSRYYCPHLSILHHSSAEGKHLWSQTGIVFTAVHIRACSLSVTVYSCGYHHHRPFVKNAKQLKSHLPDGIFYRYSNISAYMFVWVQIPSGSTEYL